MELNDFQIFEGIATRTDLKAGVTLPSFCIGKTVEVWAFVNTEKRTFASNSFYLGAACGSLMKGIHLREWIFLWVSSKNKKIPRSTQD